MMAQDSRCRRTSKRPSVGVGLFLTLLLAALSLLLLPNAVLGVTSEPQLYRMQSHSPASTFNPPTTTVPTCLDKEKLKNLSREVKARRLYVNEKEEVLTMLSSGRVPQQLMTRIVAIFLKDWLGYVNLTITTVPNTFHPSAVVDAMTAPKTPNTWNNTTIEPVIIPKAMVNLEVWIPPGYNLEPLTSDFETSSYLGSGGRFGWFLPESIRHSDRQSDANLDHWRSFIYPDTEALRVFSRTADELKGMSAKMRDPDTGEYYCRDEFGCHKGMYTPSRCQENKVCAVLFASYADVNVTKFLKKQIETMGAYVRVIWIGPNLDHSFVKENSQLKDDRSVLIFHWWPSVLLQPFNFTSVGFSPCIDSSTKSDGDLPYQCKYEMHRFHKFVWKKLKRYANVAYLALHKVQINHGEFMELMKTYNEVQEPMSVATLDRVACDWIKKNRQNQWDSWWPGNDKDELKLIGLFPITASDESRNKFIAPGNVPAFHLAVNAINKNNSILADFKIEQITLNGACETAMVMRQFIEIIQTASSEGFYNSMIGFVGPACSDTVEPVAGVSKYFNMPIISYGAEGAIFSDEDYPYFFRTIPENKIFRYVYNEFFSQMNWHRVASLNEDGQRYSEYLTLLQDLLNENDIHLYIRKYPQERAERNMTQYLQDLKQKKYFIIIGDFYEDVARAVICDAYRMQMTGHKKYLWFLPHWYSAEWYNTDRFRDEQGNITLGDRPSKENGVSCSTEEMKIALQGHMSLSYKYFADDETLMQENKTVKEWREEYAKAVKNLGSTAEESNYAGFTYDAVWAYALALDALFKEDQAYAADLRAPNTTKAYISKIRAVAFDGVSGPINFTSGSRMTDVIIWQFRGDSYREVGRFHPGLTKNDTGSLHVESELYWPSGKKPEDGSDKCDIEAFRSMLNVECRTAVIVLCALCFGGLAVILIACFIVFKRRYERKLEQMQEFWRGRPLFEIFDGWEIPRDKVVINRKIGEGAFGTVYGGECQFDTQGWVAVAVKTLKVGSTITEKLDFLSEAEMMKNFDHENIVRLLGVCTKSEPIYTVMEFMLYADLKTYLLARRNLVNEKSRNDDDEVSNKRLTSMALDIAKGLAYLAEMKYVHRDVASRNCLVNSNRTVKLADFGMTRPMYENNYYKFNRKGMLPVRWMAPESLTEGVFTTMSDVWSYGVLLYEIVTFGAFPFQGMSNDQVLEHVKAGHTIAIPRGVKPQLEILLRSCWNHVPSGRPHIQQIIDHLTNYPRLISPCLDGPQSSVQIEDTVSLELRIPDKARKLSLSINNRLPQVVSSSRNRSMSGNMVMNIPPLTTSLSEDGMISAHSNLDALNLNQNLNHVTLEENEMGEDPLLPPAQYVPSRYVSMPHKDFKIKENIVCRQQGDYCSSDIASDLWTNVTPV